MTWMVYIHVRVHSTSFPSSKLMQFNTMSLWLSLVYGWCISHRLLLVAGCGKVAAPCPLNLRACHFMAQDCKCWELRIVSRLCLLKFDDEPAKRAESIDAKTPTKCSSAMNSRQNRSSAWLHSLRTDSLNPENNYLGPVVSSTARSGCSNVNAIKKWSGFGGFQVILAVQMAQTTPRGYHSSRALCPLCLQVLQLSERKHRNHHG